MNYIVTLTDTRDERQFSMILPAKSRAEAMQKAKTQPYLTIQSCEIEKPKGVFAKLDEKIERKQ